jgi:hypothetical protein
MVYLTIISVSQEYTASNVRIIVDNELERMWGKSVVAYNIPAGLRKIKKNLSKDIRCPVRDRKPGTSRMQAGPLLLDAILTEQTNYTEKTARSLVTY